MMMADKIPATMKAIRYNKPKDWELVTIPVPEPQPHEILVQDGDFEADMPVVTGHETSGVVVKLGSDVRGFEIGDRVTADCSEVCGYCHFCRQGRMLLCENFKGHGQHLNGGFAEYCVFSAAKLFHFENLSWKEASLFEAAACAVHGMDKIKPEVGSQILVLGAGATGLCLAQLLKLNGGSHVVMASNAGPKMDLARSLGVADEYIDLNREDAAKDWLAIKQKRRHGYDIVVEATGSHRVLEKSIDFCTRGGVLLFYGVYDADAKISLSPSRVMLDELRLIGSLSQIFCVPRAVEYLQSRKVDVRGIVTHTFKLEEFGQALEAMRSKKCIKATIMME